MVKIDVVVALRELDRCRATALVMLGARAVKQRATRQRESRIRVAGRARSPNVLRDV